MINKKLTGTKTEKNLMEAFAGESMARNKYTFYASQAKKDGYIQISNIFEMTANNEKEHAELWYKQLHGGKIGTTAENLLLAHEGENYEWTNMYKRMAIEAHEEGFSDIARLFEGVAGVEKKHDERYSTLLTNLNENRVFEKPEETIWICLNCGHVHKSKIAPKICPVCSHPQAYFQILKKDY